MGELQLKQITMTEGGSTCVMPMALKAATLFSGCKKRNLSGSADNLLGGVSRPSDDMARRSIGISQSASLEQLAVYDQDTRKLSFQVLFNVYRLFIRFYATYNCCWRQGLNLVARIILF